MAAKKRKSSVESLEQPSKLSPEEAEQVKGGLLINPIYPIQPISPLYPLKPTSPYSNDTCASTSDTGMMGCPG